MELNTTLINLQNHPLVKKNKKSEKMTAENHLQVGENTHNFTIGRDF